MTAQQLVDGSVIQLAVYVGSALIGQVLHAVKKWLEGESLSMLGWLRPSPKRVLGSFIGNLALILGFASTGVLDSLSLGACIALGLFQGISASSFNVKRG